MRLYFFVGFFLLLFHFKHLVILFFVIFIVGVSVSYITEIFVMEIKFSFGSTIKFPVFWLFFFFFKSAMQIKIIFCNCCGFLTMNVELFDRKCRWSLSNRKHAHQLLVREDAVDIVLSDAEWGNFFYCLFSISFSYFLILQFSSLELYFPPFLPFPSVHSYSLHLLPFYFSVYLFPVS